MTIDLPRLGHEIDVEASGDGFDDTKRPKMLFEPHRFGAALGYGAAALDALWRQAAAL